MDQNSERGGRPELFTTIDMTPDGRILPPRVSAGLTWPVRIGLAAVVVAVVAGFAASAVILLWLASILVPLALVAGLIAYGALRFQLWRNRSAAPGGRSTAWRAPIRPQRSRP